MATPPPHLVDMKVAKLIKTDRGVWDEELIKVIVSERDANIIRQLPIAENPQDDVWYWRYDIRGTYSIRSIYRARQETNSHQI